MDRERAYGFFMVREGSQGLSGREIPQADCRVHTACDDLRI